MHTFWTWSLHLIYVQGSKLASFILGICPIFYCSRQGEGNFNKRQDTKKSEDKKRIQVESRWKEKKGTLLNSHKGPKRQILKWNGTLLSQNDLHVDAWLLPSQSIHPLFNATGMFITRPHCALKIGLKI